MNPASNPRQRHASLRQIVLCTALSLGLLAPSMAQQQNSVRSPGPSEWQAAFNAVELNPDAIETYRGDPSFQRNPLFAWMDALATDKRLREHTPAEVAAVLDRHPEQPASDWLRARWLRELVQREDHQNFLAQYRGSEDASLRCASLNAQLQLDRRDASWKERALALWLRGDSLPGACDAVFARLETEGHLDTSLRWQRIDLAIAEENAGLVRALAGKLPGDQSPVALSYADYLGSPHPHWKDWPLDARSQEVAVRGLRRLAKRDPNAAESLLGAVQRELRLSNTAAGRVRYEIALWTVASYGEQSAERLARVPEANYDPRLHEFRAREAMHRRDWNAALDAFTKMPAEMRADARWQYYEARMREILGQAAAADALFNQAARSPTFFGFLAADRRELDYALCPIEVSEDPTLRNAVAMQPALSRAIGLQRIGRGEFAAREWAALMKGLGDTERKMAIELAQKAGWYDRATFFIGSQPEDLRHYRLRFPLPYESRIREAAAAQQLDAAWVAAQTRAESSFMSDARSSADARGLMQILPGTGAEMAARLGRPWQGGNSLYDPDTNVELGTAYLRAMMERFEGLPYVAIAAYNAGPAPVLRWRAQHGDLAPDLWIETIPFKETRDYVARVLAFSVIYDWRLDGSARPVTERMLGHFDSQQRRKFSCPAP